MSRPAKSVTSLADIQREMFAAISRPLTRGEEMQSGNAATATAIIRPNDRLSSFERLQIYNQQYWWRLLGNFGEDFAGLCAVIGERKFDKLAVAYLESCPSTSWTLGELGAKLERFLRENPALTAPHTALAIDVARVEWARSFAFDAGEKPRLKPRAAQRTPPDRLKISLQPHLTLLDLAYPADELLLKFKQRQNASEVGTLSNAMSGTARRHRPLRIKAQPSRERIHLAVHRHDFRVYYKRLAPEAYRLLTALRGGAPLDSACEIAFTDSHDLPENSAAKVQEWFADWMHLGWLCAGQSKERGRPAPVHHGRGGAA